MWIGTFLFLIICYRFAFKNTIDEWHTHRQLREKLDQAGNLAYQPDYTQRKSHNLDKIIGLYKADTNLLRNNIINTIALIAEDDHVRLTAVPVQDMAYRTDIFIIARLDFEGDYFSLLKTANQLQKTKDIGMICSESWKVKHIRTSIADDKKLGLSVFLKIAK